MRRLSDFKGDEAIDLWADLLEPLTKILGDKKVADSIKAGLPKMIIAKDILKTHKKETEEILLKIDPEPLDGLNIVLRLVNIIVELGENDMIRSFFGFAEQAKKDSESSGSVMESTEEKEN